MKERIEAIKDVKIKKIKEEWRKLIEGQQVDRSVVSPLILNSWERCLQYGVNPYTPLDRLIPLDEEIKKLTNCEDLLAEYGQIIEVIKEIAREAGLICRLADSNAKTFKVIATPEVVRENFKKGNFFAMDASEQLVGTNALYLSIKENRPIQVLGPEHFNYYFHSITCSAAPIHNEKGEVIGVINISTNSYRKTTIQTLGLVIAIARVLDNQLYINKMLDELTVHNAILHQIMEYLPYGVIYFNENKEIQSYNKKILYLLKLDDCADESTVKRLLLNYIGELGCLHREKEFTNEEILLNLKGKIESFLVTKRNIVIPREEHKGNILMLENTDSILKLHGSLRGNNAIYTFDNILGSDPKLIEAKHLTQRVAKSSCSVVIRGESGTGKELFAQAIHNASPRKNKPFVAINCGAIPSELIESELFGYEAGAFTGALKGGRPGKLEIASGGTLFLDEIESMPLNLQIKLLRALSSSCIVRVGGNREIPIDIRLISATKKDLLKEVEKGNFREDLYYRINVFTIELPPLRDRKTDIPILVDHFIRFFAPGRTIEIEDEFWRALEGYSWRGNIRELRNIIERALLLMGQENKLTLYHLPSNIVNEYLSCKLEKQMKIKRAQEQERCGLLKIAEEVALEMALKDSGGNLTKTAERLGIARSTLYQKIKENKRLSSVLISVK